MAKVSEYIWKIWLRLNFLTQDVDNDYTGEVSTVGHTIRNEDIARRIVRERSELRYETILSILNERDGIVLESVLGGSSVQDGVVHIAPSVTGLWIGTDRTVDPSRQKPSVSISSATALREGLANVKMEIIGMKDSGSVEEMSKWVEYITFDGESPMSSLRRQNGREKPWKVKFWGVGNESWGCGGNMTSAKINDYNSFENPNMVVVKDFNDVRLSGGKWNIQLPEKSIVMLEIE
jgi:hypothetical protein